MTPTKRLKATKTSVRAPYTFENVRQLLIDQRNAPDAKRSKTSYRKIGARYGVSHAVIHRIVQYGYEPKDNKIRAALGLPPCTVAVEPCAKCGQVHTLKHCPEAPRKYAPHPVMRITAIRRLLQSPYRDS